MEPLLDENGKTVTPPEGTSLLDLPDELISRIFELLRGLDIVSADKLVINKRLYRLMLPIWYRWLDFPIPNHWEQDKFYGHLISDEHLLDHTHHVLFAYNAMYPNIQVSVLKKFAHLRTLTIMVYREDGMRPNVDEHLCGLLRALPSLQELYHDDDRVPPRSAPIADFKLLRDTSVTRLHVTTVESALALLGSQGYRSTRRLEELVVEGSGSPSYLRSTLLWLVSDRLVLREALDLPILEGIVDELKRLNRESPLLPLKYLELKMYGTVGNGELGVQPYATQYWSSLSHLLPLFTPRHLCLTDVRGLPAIEDSAEAFPSVEILEVESDELYIERSSDHARLCCLIDVFPSLTHFTVHCVYLERELESGDGLYDFCTLSSRKFRSQHPIFAAFIAHIKDTPIVSFHLFHKKYALVCWRAAATEDFKADMITL
ncbi:hypothetical protein JCM10449v2_005647 [Rhodotorula kratochvilovae]